MAEKQKGATLVDLNIRSPGRAMLVRSQTFTLERVEGAVGIQQAFGGGQEMMLLVPTGGVGVIGDRETIAIAEPAIAILPPGDYRLSFTAQADAYILATHRSDLDPEAALNAADYHTADGRVAAVGGPFARVADPGAIVVYPIAAIQVPPTNGRIKFLQAATLSINWVEYEGARDRKALSPHKHADLEQMTLAIRGHYIHHLRSDWGPDADLWREDIHLDAGPGSVIVIPPEIIHTTEGVGDGKHLLVDIFAPPRRDFLAKDWIFNAHDYVDPRRQ